MRLAGCRDVKEEEEEEEEEAAESTHARENRLEDHGKRGPLDDAAALPDAFVSLKRRRSAAQDEALAAAACATADIPIRPPLPTRVDARRSIFHKLFKD